MHNRRYNLVQYKLKHIITPNAQQKSIPSEHRVRADEFRVYLHLTVWTTSYFSAVKDQEVLETSITVLQVPACVHNGLI